MSDTPYIWGGEHFCQPDLNEVYHKNLSRTINPEIGWPKKLDERPEPETFCSVCLKWFTDPATLAGSERRPPADPAEE